MKLFTEDPLTTQKVGRVKVHHFIAGPTTQVDTIFSQNKFIN